MQRAEESTPNPPTTGAEPTRAISPVKAFFILLLVLVTVLGGAYLVTRSDEPSPVSTTATRGPGFQLTDEQALERFRELDALRVRAFTHRDLTLVHQYLSADSPILVVNLDEIRQLITDKIMFDPGIVSSSVEVVANSPEQVIVRQEIEQRPRFTNESGRDVSRSRESVSQIVLWILQFDGQTWKIYDADVSKSRLISSP
jgi:hypothetical protein